MITGKNLIGYIISTEGDITFSASILEEGKPPDFNFQEASQQEMDSDAMMSTSNGHSTSLGTNAICRFTRAVCYQNSPRQLLTEALKNDNPLHIWRKLNGTPNNHAIG